MQHALLLAQLLAGQVEQHVAAAQRNRSQGAVDAATALVTNRQGQREQQQQQVGQRVGNVAMERQPQVVAVGALLHQLEQLGVRHHRRVQAVASALHNHRRRQVRATQPLNRLAASAGIASTTDQLPIAVLRLPDALVGLDHERIRREITLYQQTDTSHGLLGRVERARIEVLTGLVMLLMHNTLQFFPALLQERRLRRQLGTDLRHDPLPTHNHHQSRQHAAPQHRTHDPVDAATNEQHRHDLIRAMQSRHRHHASDDRRKGSHRGQQDGHQPHVVEAELRC